jgi:hypothetical protein
MLGFLPPQPEIIRQFFRDVDRTQRLASFSPIAELTSVHRFPQYEQTLVIVEIAPAQPEQFTRTTQVSSFLADAIDRVGRGELDPRVANSMGYLAVVLLRALEQGPVEDLAKTFDGAKVVCSTVGRFIYNGPAVIFIYSGAAVIEAASQAGCHYIDISSEQAWLRQVAEHWDEKFRRARPARRARNDLLRERLIGRKSGRSSGHMKSDNCTRPRLVSGRSRI